MKTIFRTLALSAAFLSIFTACQREVLEQNQEPETSKTHTVTFVAGSPETKTTVDISDGETAKFAWTEADQKRFVVYENGAPAIEKTTVGVLGDDGKMAIKATFDGEATGNDKYVAVVNKSNEGQIMTSESYDEDADILVSKEVTVFDGENGTLLQFKREVAIAKMTIKGLDAGEVVSMVTVSSTADIAGSYGVEGWVSPKTSLEISSAYAMGEETGYKITANESGEAVVWFTCIPQDKSTLTVMVEAADGDTYTKEFSKEITLTRGDVKGFGVAMEKDAKDQTLSFDFVTHPSDWKTSSSSTNNVGTYYYSLNGTDFSFTSDGDIYCGGTSVTSGYLMIKSGYHLGLPSLSGYRLAKVIGTLNDSGSPSTKSSVSITDSDSKTVEGGDAQIWNSKGASFTYTLLNTDENAVYYLSPTSANLQMIKLVLTYEPAKARTVLTAPTNLAVSAEKVVSWDAVDGAASYVLTIGSDEYPCETNSYNASKIADEYYDVAVVAVPSDTENYKNSDAATLRAAKFGTPTLSTPEITAGVIEETSVAFSWTKDTRATSGYHWALYNGETLIKEATETSATSAKVTSLGFGTTYTAKVYAVAVDGEKPYVQSATATRDLTTKAKTTISTIVTGSGSTTYAISDLTVMAVSGKYFVVKDETGIMTAYKSTNATAAVGDIATLEGTYGATNGLNLFTYTSYSKGDTPGVVDYGTPFVLNSENISDYTSNSSLKYVKATVSVGSDGSTLSIGSTAVYMRPSSGVSVSEYAGKTITMLGYAFGYDTSYKNVVILATSVEIDQTVPSLAVTPTSKTWANDEVDAATFTVTTNTKGEKDWTVSPETLEWATIAVDKAKGTITVTPKDANTTETAREATLTVTHSKDASIVNEIKLKQNGTGAVLTEETIEIKYTDIPSGYASNGTSGTFIKNTSQTANITIGYAGLNTKSSSGTAYDYTMFLKNKGYMYSNTALDGYYVKSVTATFSSGTGTSGKAGITLSSTVSSSRNSTVSGSVSKNGTITTSNEDTTLKYWNLSTTEANVQIVSVKVVYAPIN